MPVRKRYGWWGPKPQPKPDALRGKFPHTDMPKLRGYEGTKCGGRHGGIEYRQTYPDETGARFCDFCGDRIRGVLSPADEAKADRTWSNLAAGGRAAIAADRAKRERKGGRWTLRKANVSRDARTGEFRKRGKR